MLDIALGAAESLDGETLAAALGEVGEIGDSPRGPWTFEGQSPQQTSYLRTVERRGDQYVNAVTADLGTFGQDLRSEE